MRIVSLDPGATELLFDLGAGDQVVGRAPGSPRSPVVAAVPVVSLDQAAIAAMAPDVVLVPVQLVASTQGLQDRAMTSPPSPLSTEWRGGGVAGGEVVPRSHPPGSVWKHLAPAMSGRRLPAGIDAGAPLGSHASYRQVALQTRRLEDVFELIGVVAAIAGVPDRGAALHKMRTARLLALRMHVARWLVRAGARRPRVVLIDDDWQALGNWIPDMLDAAGAVAPLARAGEPARPITPEDIRRASIDVALLGLRPENGETLRQALARSRVAPTLADAGGAPAPEAWAVDLTHQFDPPGLALIEGVETLIRILTPAALGVNRAPPPAERALKLRPPA